MADTFDPDRIMPSDEALARVITAIDEYNARRPRAQIRVYLQLAGVFAPFVAISGWLLYLGVKGVEPDGIGSYVVGAIFVGLIYLGKFLWQWCWQPATDLQGDTRYRLFPEIFGFVDQFRYSNGVTPRFMHDLPIETIMPYRRVTHDDLITGRLDGITFEMGECTFYSGSGKSERMEFRGVVFHCTAPTPFPGTLIISKAQTAANRFWFGGPNDRHLFEIQAADWKVNSVHSLRSDQPGAAQKLINTSLGAGLLWLDRYRSGGGVARIALRGKDIYLLVPAERNLFELPGIESPVDFKMHVEPMIRELVQLLAAGALIRKAVAAPDAPAPQADTGQADTGQPNKGQADTAQPDSGQPDTGHADSGAPAAP